jgi:hypothetical protein
MTSSPEAWPDHRPDVEKPQSPAWMEMKSFLPIRASIAQIGIPVCKFFTNSAEEDRGSGAD